MDATKFLYAVLSLLLVLCCASVVLAAPFRPPKVQLVSEVTNQFVAVTPRGRVHAHKPNPSKLAMAQISVYLAAALAIIVNGI